MEKIITIRKNGSKRVQVKTNGVCKVQQHLKDEVSLECMLEKYSKTGTIKSLGQPIFGDFSKISSYHEAKNQLLQAESQFLAIDPKIRQKFDNDPQKMIDFLSDKKNVVQAVELGLLPKSALESLPQPKKTADKAKEPEQKDIDKQ